MNSKRFVAAVVLLLGFAASSSKAELVSHWKLDDAVGTNPVVDSKSGFDAAQAGSPVLGIPGVAGTAGSFPTGNNYYLAPANAAFGLESFTFSTWFNSIGNPGGGHNVVISNRTGENGFIVYQHNNDIEFWLRKTTGGWQTQIVPIALGDDQWYHLAGSFDAATGDKKFYVTLDSAAAANVPLVLTGADQIVTATPTFGIGVRGDGGLPLKNGYIDDVQFYNTVLSDADVNTLFQNPGVALGEIPEPSTVVLAALGLLGLLGFGRRRRK